MPDRSTPSKIAVDDPDRPAARVRRAVYVAVRAGGRTTSRDPAEDPPRERGPAENAGLHVGSLRQRQARDRASSRSWSLQAFESGDHTRDRYAQLRVKSTAITWWIPTARRRSSIQRISSSR